MLAGKMFDLQICNRFQGKNIPGFTKSIVKKLRKLRGVLMEIKYAPDFISKISISQLFQDMHQILT